MNIFTGCIASRAPGPVTAAVDIKSELACLADPKNHKEYTAQLTKESSIPPNPCFRYNSSGGESWISFAANHVYKNLVVPAANMNKKVEDRYLLDSLRIKVANESSDRRFKRVNIIVNHYVIDGMIYGKTDTLLNKKWVLASLGNSAFYEYEISNPKNEIRQFCDSTGSNALFFNYPEVGDSKGKITRHSLKDSYKAALAFLEDKRTGIGADTIIGYGFSIGGGVQGIALLEHTLKDDIRYLFIKKQTFSNLDQTAFDLTDKFAPAFARPFVSPVSMNYLEIGMDNFSSCLHVSAPQIILQRSIKPALCVLRHAEEVKDDGIITAESSLALALLQDPKNTENKLILGVPEDHFTELKSIQRIGAIANHILETNKIENALIEEEFFCDSLDSEPLAVAIFFNQEKEEEAIF
jgi:hypothetical protein